jgi:hypothetical protein
MKLDTNVSPDDFPKFIQLLGLPIISRLQFSILLALYDPTLPDGRQCLKALTLPTDPHQRAGYRASLKSLMKRDYITGTRDASQCWITLRGVKVLREILQRCIPKDAARREHLCCRCKQRPRHQRPTYLHSWCLECTRAYEQRDRSLGLKRPNPDLPCARCKSAARYTSASGIASQYCPACKVVVQREKRQARQIRDRARVERGDVLTCKCGQPVYVTANYVSKRCKGCERAHTARRRSDQWKRKKLKAMATLLSGQPRRIKHGEES